LISLPTSFRASSNVFIGSRFNINSIESSSTESIDATEANALQVVSIPVVVAAEAVLLANQLSGGTRVE
jgi:hypothetical protein